MSPHLAFTPAKITEIGKAISSLFSPIDGKEAMTGASATNVIVAGVDLRQLDRATEFIELLAPVHPARFFMPVVDGSIDVPQAFVAAVCVRVSNNSSVCSEIIKLLMPESQRSAMPSIIRANMLPGLPSEVAVFGWDYSTEYLVRQADLSMFDSRDIRAAELLELLSCVTRNHVPTIDFNWVRLSQWREEVKRLFDMPGLTKLLPDISRVVIASGSFSPRSYDVGAFTLAGWILDRLDVEPLAYGHDGWECASRSRHPITVRIDPVEASQGATGIARVEFWIRHPDGEKRAVSIHRGEALESVVEIPEHFSVRRRFEPDDRHSVVERYFLVGDSTMNYESSQKIGLDMYHLTRGFEG